MAVLILPALYLKYDVTRLVLTRYYLQYANPCNDYIMATVLDAHLKTCEGYLAFQKFSERRSNKTAQGFPDGAVIKNPPANAGDTGLSPGPGRSHMPWSN